MNLQNKLGLVILIFGINVFIEAIKLDNGLGSVYMATMILIGFYMFVTEDIKIEGFKIKAKWKKKTKI